MRDVINGAPVFRTYLYVPKTPGTSASRILFDCAFAISALTGIFVRMRPDLIIRGFAATTARDNGPPFGHALPCASLFAHPGPRSGCRSRNRRFTQGKHAWKLG
jgi:hypothetical protein